MTFREFLDHKDDKVLWRVLLVTLLDKGLFGLVAVGLGLLANWMLESYRVEHAQQQILLEYRLKSFTDTHKAYAELVKELLVATTADHPTAEQQKRLRELVLNVTNTTTSAEPILPRTYYLEIERQLWIIGGVLWKDPATWKTYRPFLIDVTRRLDAIWPKILPVDGDKATAATEHMFPLEPARREDMLSMKSQEFFDRNFERWQSEHKRQTTAP